MTLAALQQSSTAPAWKWDFAYPLPADCLRVIEFVGEDEEDVSDWEVSGREILCDEDTPVYIAYIRREEDPTKYDPLLCKALSAALAAELAYPLSAGVTAMQAAQQRYDNALREARGVDARQGSSTDDTANSTWFKAKYGG